MHFRTSVLCLHDLPESFCWCQSVLPGRLWKTAGHPHLCSPSPETNIRFLIGLWDGMMVKMLRESSAIFSSFTMTIWLVVLVWPIWGASGCSAWGETIERKPVRNNAKFCLPHSQHRIEQVRTALKVNEWLQVTRFALLTWAFLGGWEWIMLELLLCCGGRCPAKHGSYSIHMHVKHSITTHITTMRGC